MADQKDTFGASFSFPGNITINGPMFDIHDNQKVENHYHFGEKQEREADDRDGEVRLRLEPFFKDKTVVDEFIKSCKLRSKDTEVTSVVNSYKDKFVKGIVKDHLWKAMKDAGLYTKGRTTFSGKVNL